HLVTLLTCVGGMEAECVQAMKVLDSAVSLSASVESCLSVERCLRVTDFMTQPGPAMNGLYAADDSVSDMAMRLFKECVRIGRSQLAPPEATQSQTLTQSTPTPEITEEEREREREKEAREAAALEKQEQKERERERVRAEKAAVWEREREAERAREEAERIEREREIAEEEQAELTKRVRPMYPSLSSETERERERETKPKAKGKGMTLGGAHKKNSKSKPSAKPKVQPKPVVHMTHEEKAAESFDWDSLGDVPSPDTKKEREAREAERERLEQQAREPDAVEREASDSLAYDDVYDREIDIGEKTTFNLGAGFTDTRLSTMGTNQASSGYESALDRRSVEIGGLGSGFGTYTDEDSTALDTSVVYDKTRLAPMAETYVARSVTQAEDSLPPTNFGGGDLSLGQGSYLSNSVVLGGVSLETDHPSRPDISGINLSSYLGAGTGTGAERDALPPVDIGTGPTTFSSTFDSGFDFNSGFGED
ncbi:hypothetical protein KIPB_003696, partial [Kipferlia bialata]